MKQLLFATNVLFLAAAIFFWNKFSSQKTELISCQQKLTESPVPPKDTSVQVCVGCAQETVGEEATRLKLVLENYRTKIWDVVNENRVDATTSNHLFFPTRGISKNNIDYGNTDARSIWFSLETLKQFICTIEKNNAKLLNPATNLGIRFYYGVYEPDYKPSEGKANRHTLFMVPTRSNGSEPAVDFDPRETVYRQTNKKEYKDEYAKSSVTFSTLIQEKFQARKALILTEAEPSINIPSTKLVPQTAGMPTFSKNNGELCPTNCPAPNTFDAIDQ